MTLILTEEFFEQEAIEFILKNEPREGYFVGFSGGKDSIVVYDLVKRSGVKHKPYFSYTGIDHPAIVKFIRRYYPEVEFIKPKRNFYSLLEQKGPATIYIRWCCDYLRETPISVVPLHHRIMGIRFEESAKRAKKPRISKLPSTSIFHYKPIFAWNEYHIWNYIEKYNLPYPDLYDQGFHRIGCVICPFIQYKQKMIHKEMYPGMFRAFEKAVHTHFVNKNKSEYAGETFEEWLDYWYHKNFFKSNKGNLNESETQDSIQSGKENQTSRTKLRILTS